MKPLLLIVLLVSCTSFMPPTQRIDYRLQEYFDMFIYEAELRELDYSDIRIEIKFDTLENLAGNGYYDELSRFSYVKIDYKNWQHKKSWYKEVLMFHELGHAVLQLSHNDDCYSLMVDKYCKYENYRVRREKMLNEYYGRKIKK